MQIGASHVVLVVKYYSVHLCNVRTLPDAGDSGDVVSILGLGSSSGCGNGNVLLYSGLGNPIDRGA